MSSLCKFVNIPVSPEGSRKEKVRRQHVVEHSGHFLHLIRISAHQMGWLSPRRALCGGEVLLTSIPFGVERKKKKNTKNWPHRNWNLSKWWKPLKSDSSESGEGLNAASRGHWVTETQSQLTSDQMTEWGGGVTVTCSHSPAFEVTLTERRRALPPSGWFIVLAVERPSQPSSFYHLHSSESLPVVMPADPRAELPQKRSTFHISACVPMKTTRFTDVLISDQ